MELGKLNSPSSSRKSLFGKSSALDRTLSDEQMMGGGEIDVVRLAGKAAIGAGIGAAAGAAAGYATAQVKILQVPVEKVELSWKEPVTREQVIGRIPADRSTWTRSAAEGADQTLKVDVRRPVALLDGHGDPIFNNLTKVFSGHGKPVIETQQRVVTQPDFQGHSLRVTSETRQDYVYQGNDSDGNAQYSWVTVDDGYRARFEPKVVDRPVNSPKAAYETYKVSFDSGVDVGKHVLTGALIGAGVGAVAGIISEVAQTTLNQRG